MNRLHHDGPLIIGGGLAGLSAALEAGPRKVLLVTPAPLLEACSSAWAQGGVAAAVAPGDDAALHAADTAAAGAGLVEPEATRLLTADGRDTVEWLAALGAPFDRQPDGGFAVSLEAAHSRARVARVGGDGAGRAILSALVAAVRAAPHVEVWEDGRLRGLIRDAAGRVRGALIERGGRRIEVLASAVVLATGGAGGLYARTTTPVALLGEGMAAAFEAGAEILDPEFVQFHPTAIDVGLDPMPLATEALRGEGARLIDGEGRYLLGEAADADLQPRDLVARAVHAARAEGRGAFLDARAAVGERFPEEFPAVFAACMRAGLDPRESPIPVAAAIPPMWQWAAALETAGAGTLLSVAAPADLTAEQLATLRATMSDDVGVVRDAAGLTRALGVIDRLEHDAHGALPLVAARLIAEAALARRESRGGHARSDFPARDAVARHTRRRGPAGADARAPRAATG